MARFPLMQRQEEEEEIQAKVDDPLAGGPIAPHNDSTFTNKHPPLQIKVNQMPPGSHLQPARTKFGRFMADAGFFLAGLPVLGIGGLAGLAGSEFAAQSTFGSGDDRRQINTPTDQLDITNNKSYVANDIAIRGGGFGSKYVLRGRRYDPKPHLAAGPGQGKAVILFSGSGGPNENQLEPVADFYAKQGTTAFAVNYRGYGGSRDKGAFGGEKNPWLSEDGLYHDARRIYKYVNQTGGFAPGDITLHGFSLGGAVASNLAKKLAKKGVQLGGLVLHSSIETAYKAAYAEGEEMGGKAVGVLGGLGSKLAAGDFSTSAHLKKLVERDPDLPVHFMSGGYGDQLALDQTGLTGIGGLNNSSSHQAGGDHLTTSSHLQGNENFLATLLQQGRNRQQGQEEAVPAI